MTGAVRGRTPWHDTTVVANRPLTPRMRRITVAAASLVGVPVAPAQEAELVLADDAGQPVKRRYTVRAARPDSGEWDVDALVHDADAPGRRFAERAAPGDALRLAGPRGHLAVRADATWVLFVADEAGLPAVASLVEALPAGVRPVAVLEVDGPADEEPIAGAAWVHRGATPPGGADLLRAALDALPVPDGPGEGFLLGESKAMIALRPVVARLGLGADRLHVKGYWNAARRR